MATQKNKLEEVIHLYLGCEVQVRGDIEKLIGVESDGAVITFSGRYGRRIWGAKEVKLLLRQLSDITAEECVEVFKLCSLFDLSDCEFEFGEGNQWINASIDGRVIDAIQFVGDNIEMMNNDGAFSAINPISPIFHYYLSKGFDLFSLIETGQAIDKNTLQETKN